MLVQDVRDYHLDRLDKEYQALRKLVGDAKFTDAGSEDYKRAVTAVIDRTRTLAEFNGAALPVANARRNGQAKPAAASPVGGSVLDTILSQQTEAN